MKKSVLIILCFVFVLGCKSPDARIPVSKKSGSFIIESVERNIELNAKEHNIIKALIEQQKDSSFITSKNGFWYKYNFKIEGDSIKPQFGDLVNFNYNIKDLDGTIIYTKEELKKAGKAVEYYEYAGDNHNISNNLSTAWSRSIEFFNKKDSNKYKLYSRV